MKKGLSALICAGLLLASLPGTVGAARVTKFTDTFASASCEGAVDGGYISTYSQASESFGSVSFLDAWLGDAIPFEDPASATGSTENVQVVLSGDDMTVEASYDLTDADGNPLGSGSISASLTKDGDPFLEQPLQSVNHHSRTVVEHQPYAGSATVNVLGTDYALECFGEATSIDAFENNPTSFVQTNAGVEIDCFWQTDDVIAGTFAVDDSFGFFAFTFLVTPDADMFESGATGSIDASGVDVAFDLVDSATGEPNGETASLQGSFEPVGSPVTSWLIQQNSRQKTVQQLLAADGSLQFSTGQSFDLDAEHCKADTFATRFEASSPKGPKPGAPPSNDTPDGAIALKVGSILNTQTTGAALDAEVPINTCPEGFQDIMGHTLWYTVQGTGRDLTIDTAGSNFDTLVAVYTRAGDEFTEVGCEDDVMFEPIGATFQAALTVPTEAGVTYYVQAGGFMRFFDPTFAQSGRLRLSIN